MAQDNDELLRDMRKRFDEACVAEEENREKAVEDLRFAYTDDGQWESKAKKIREGRPCYTFNKIRGAIRQVVNDQRQSRPGIKVRAVDDRGDPEMAEVLNGMIRNIESTSNAEFAYDNGFEYAVGGGFGAWRVTTQYADEETFDQECCIKPIRNPFTVYFDPSAKFYDKRDAGFCFVTEMLSEEEFTERYPDASMLNFDMSGAGERYEQWYTDKKVRVAEYWLKKEVEKRILQLSDGAVVEADKDFDSIRDELAAAGITVVRERKVRVQKVFQYVVSANEVLQGPTEWPGKYIPIVPVYGECIDIEGEMFYSGLVRWSKDAQRSYNYHRSTMVELIDLQPKTPLQLTPAMIKGHEKMWKESNRRNLPFLLYNTDPASPTGKPYRERPADIPAAYLQEAQIASDDIKSTTGIYDASLGQRSNETSGKAILARQREGDVATFAFTDNLSRSIQYTGEILVDLIPKIYDTERVVRILGEDGGEKFAQINREVIDQQTGQKVKYNDISAGRYDVTVTTGPSYTTKRLEFVDMWMNMAQSTPELAQMTLDLWARSLDMPHADEIHKRVRKMLISQGIVEPESEEEMPQPDPQQQAAQEAGIRKLFAEVQKLEMGNAKTAAETQKLQSGAQIDGMKAQAELTRDQAEVRKIAAETASIVIENLIRQGVIGDPAKVSVSA